MVHLSEDTRARVSIKNADSGMCHIQNREGGVDRAVELSTMRRYSVVSEAQARPQSSQTNRIRKKQRELKIRVEALLKNIRAIKGVIHTHTAFRSLTQQLRNLKL